ncbi:hypothetical protein Angca_008927, partial [Angiostrongylus cantonensis]
SASECVGENATTYLRSDGTRLMEFPTHSISDVSLNVCAEACTDDADGHMCSSFEYDARSRECLVHADDGQPFGPSVLAKTNKSVAYFQKMCVIGEALCSSPYAFERFPQSILIGHAMKVLNVTGLSECLSQCLATSSSLSTECRSVMYFYERGECIINRERRVDRPDLFVEDVQNQLVDYFENNCHDGSCNLCILVSNLQSYSPVPENPEFLEPPNSWKQGFSCRTFPHLNIVELCKKVADTANRTNFSYNGRRGSSLSLNPNPSEEYFEKYCLEAPITCLGATFEQVPGRTMNVNPHEEFGTTSVNSCLAACLEDRSQCVSAVFDYEKDLCLLFERSQFTHPELFIEAENVDYFEVVCDDFIAAKYRTGDESALHGFDGVLLEEFVDTQSVVDDHVVCCCFCFCCYFYAANNYLLSENPSRLSTPSSRSPDQSNDVYGDEFEVKDTVTDDTDNVMNREHTLVKAKLTSECRRSGVTVCLEFASPTSGSLYVKDNFGTCRLEFQNATYAELHIPFPRSDDPDPRCPGIEIAPLFWSFSIAVQKNEMDSPSLVTSTNRFFNVTCDFTDMLSREKEYGLPTDDDDGGEAQLGRIQMQILQNGRAITTVLLGDEVTLKWTILDKTNGLDYFVDDCIAERVGGVAPHPEPLKIIQHGYNHHRSRCPEKKVLNHLINSPIIRQLDGFSTKMKAVQVFRFDGSRRVRIRCTIDVCVDYCGKV